MKVARGIEKARVIAAAGSDVALEQVNRPVMAALAVVAAMATIGFIDNFVPRLATHTGLWQFHAMRTAMVLPLLAIAGVILGTGWRMRRPKAVLFRSCTVAVAMLIYFGCLPFLPIGVVVAGLFTAPLFVLVISALFLGKSVGPWRWGAAALGFAGILLVIWPENGFAGAGLVALIPVTGGVFYALTNIATRQWCEGETALILTVGNFAALGLAGLVGMAALYFWGAPEADSFVLRPPVAMTLPMLALVLMQAVGSTIGVALQVRGYQLGEASFVSIFEYSLMVFAALWAFVLWGEVPGARALAGMALIVISGIVIALRSR